MRAAERKAWTLLVCAWVLAVPGATRAQSQEEKRRQLQERLGIKPAPPGQAPAPDAGVIEPGAPSPVVPQGAVRSPAAPPARTPSAAVRPRVPDFDDARPILEKACGSCHGPEGMASRSRWVLRGEPGDYDATVRFVQPATAAQSPLLKKGTGTSLHGGKKALAVESAEYATLLRWIEGGAPPGRARAGTSAHAASRPEPSASAQAGAPSTAPSASTHPGSPTPTPSTPASSGASSTAPSAPAQAGAPSATNATASQAGSAATAPADAAHTGSPAPTASASSSAPTTSSGAVTAAQRFAPQVHEALLADCSSCHASDGMAGASRYVTHTDPDAHLRSVTPLVVPGDAANSLLYQRAKGDSHPGGAVWEPGSAQLALLARWIDMSASGSAPPATASAAVPTPSAPAPSKPPVPAGPHPHAGVPLGTFPVLGSLSLNGRFDLNYERVNYNDHPFKSEGESALRSYHHFLFLTRQSAEDPVTLTLEVLSLQFWELGYRVSGESWPVKVFAKGGKVLVPFGGDPLFHHSYGGLAGFDQRVLPVVFAREGLTVNVEHRLGPLALSGDAYVIAGYRLKRADAVLNLQSDLAPLEDTRLGVGARLGAAWGPINLWYSPYYNSLGFGRRLFLQALDVAVWRPRGLPVLEHFSLGAGLLRADVSGGEAEGYGGPGADYYHFASYLQLRYHPTDWLYVQYRQGLRTFGNRRGLILDENALTREDGSSHNLGVVARWRGLSAGLYQYWNLEKTDETPDDFTRLVVAYEF
ncbi:hypothetical protein JYK02_13935 [Corallococcus macrosporus]|uniref:Cytochrome c domain-containing protein n=1 Tax=Corallococcus macrosporus TaxID=35 RepID=A0ABS3DA95_9BACT|nr:hypothetical protein [Corallococcus macrosporus]MBN8228608.1 hypothetical protein [Corallococcus macrosporus]